MINLDPRAAANKLRPHWKEDPPPVSPDDRHKLVFLEEVCKQLGVEPNLANVSHAAHLMGKYQIGQYHPNEYPKMLTAKDKLGRTVPVRYPEAYPDGHEKAGEGHPLANTDVILQSKEHEDEVRKDMPHLFDDHPNADADAKVKAEAVARAKASKAKADDDLAKAEADA